MSTPLSIQPTTPAFPRRHDLDALRAVAMLLGIALHAALAYMPLPEGGWPVQDAHQNDAFAVFLAVVHGFRMPLFFLISGFFTAMMWRKRGVKSLLVNRFKRIFLPLAIGMFTLVPAVWIVSIAAGIAGAQSAEVGANANLWTAAKLGNLEEVEQLLADGASPNTADPATGATPMAMAGWTGQHQAIELLIDQGANVDARNADGTTPIHGAAFFGHAESVRMLVEHGADVDAKNKRGERAIDVLAADWSTTQLVASLAQVEVNRDQVISGRKEVYSILQEASQSKLGTGGQEGEGTGDSQQSDVGISDADVGDSGNEALSGIMMLLMWFPFFHHLWFLWFLCWLVLAFAVYAKLADLLRWKAPRSLVISPLRYLWLIPLTILPQSMMGLLFPNFGPDTSPGLLPMPQVMLYYGIFFFFGAIYFDCDDQQGRVGRWWRYTLPVALLLVFPVGLELTTGGLGFGTEWLDPELHRPLSVVLQVVYVWLMTFGLMGMFRSLMSGESKAVRYVSDSSYWLYLVHLPLIIVAQAIVRNWQLPAFAKFTLVCVVTSALLLASYQLFVRYTPIGTLLNGPRVRPKKPHDAAAENIPVPDAS